MPSKLPFLGPETNQFFIKLFRLALPFLFKKDLSGLKVDISEDDYCKLKELTSKRLLILPNHPTDNDPYVLLELSKRLNRNFNAVAAREVFDLDGGLRGKIFQLVGGYSIIRGGIDRDSFKMSREMLTRGENPLVIFIEGEVTYENDTLHPFEPGVIQLAFWAQEDILKLSRNQISVSQPDEGINILPFAIKYFFEGNHEQAIEKALLRLESALNVNNSSSDLYLRLRIVGEKILSIQENRLEIIPSKDDLSNSLTERIQRIKTTLFEKMEKFLGIPIKLDQSITSRIHVIRNKVDKLGFTYQEEDHLSEYEKNVLAQTKLTLKGFYNDLNFLANFSVIRDGYVAEKKSPERFIEVLQRMEKEVFGEVKLKLPRIAKVKLGEVINTKQKYEEYKSNKKDTVQTIASKMERNMREMLQAISTL